MDKQEPLLQINTEADFAAQEYCRSLWGAARGHFDWRKFHNAFVAGYKAAATLKELNHG